MDYIIMDLEWNSAYSRKKKGFINEIIEIGAVKLNADLQEKDSFSVLIKPTVGKKLQGRVKALTHLSNEDVQNGLSYREAILQFRQWVGAEENVFLSWGDGDIRAMIQNNAFFLEETTLPSMQNYVDIQKYCQTQAGLNSGQQIGLSDAAEKIGLDPEKYAHHRALDDSRLTADCFKALFEEKHFKSAMQKADKIFYEKLAFKPYYLKDMHDSRIDPAIFQCVCDVCGGKIKKEKNWRFQNHAFYAVFYCKHCDRHIRFTVRCKQLYDALDIRKTSREVVPKPKEETENPQTKSTPRKPKNKPKKQQKNEA